MVSHAQRRQVADGGAEGAAKPPPRFSTRAQRVKVSQYARAKVTELWTGLELSTAWPGAQAKATAGSPPVNERLLSGPLSGHFLDQELVWSRAVKMTESAQ
jgi:hypothetical protein